MLPFSLANFYVLYNFDFTSKYKYIGVGINEVNFSVVDGSLPILADWMKQVYDYSSKIQINYNEQEWFEKGFINHFM